MHSYDSVESLIDGERESNIHVECSRPVTMRALDTVRGLYKNRRCAFYLRSDRGFDRDSVRSYLRFFGVRHQGGCRDGDRPFRIAARGVETHRQARRRAAGHGELRPHEPGRS